MNNKKPLLICKALARKRKLRYSGARNALGCILGTRNNRWLRGTAPALCIGLTGGNTDVSPNDRLPILPETHEDNECKHQCAKKTRIAKITRLTQIAQGVTNGYFGGYMGKRQPSGKMETHKCIKKMYTLRDKNAGKTQKKRQRAVTNRMVTDIEMNGTLRGAVETFNLAKHLRKNDVLFAECIRTFPTVDVNVRSFLHRLDVELQHVEVCRDHAYVPPTSKPSARNRRSAAPMVDLYGFRPLEQPWRMLCVFEFIRWWCAEPVLAPHQYQHDEDRRSMWTQAGLEIQKTQKYKDGKVQLVPGIHFLVCEPMDEEYYTFPTEPAAIYGTFRHRWVLMRRKRPYVPILEGAPLPRMGRSAEENARYCSVFFRPWTLCEGSAEVPHLRWLGTAAEDIPEQAVAPRKKERLHGKQFAKRPVQCKFSIAWNRYIKEVPSESAATYIRNFLTSTMARGATADDQAEDADASDVDAELPRFTASPQDIKAILERKELTKRREDSDDENPTEAAPTSEEPAGMKEERKRRRNAVAAKNMHARAVQRSELLWKTSPSTVPVHERSGEGPQHRERVEEHLKARHLRGKEEQKDDGPFSGDTAPRAQLYPSKANTNLEAWFTTLMSKPQSERPNAEQLAFLRGVKERLLIEIREERARSQAKSKNEPMLDLLHGLPGTGKSRVVAWLRQLFEEAFEWTHGVQFVYLAFQNAMAAHMNGQTIHHWSGIPAMEAAGSAGTKSANDLSTKCQCLRFIVIDEISTVSGELLAALERVVQKVVRVRGTYKRRTDGTMRAFGGINLVMLGDWWQHAPVASTALFDDPGDAVGSAAHGLEIFWGYGPNSIRRLWELTAPMRCVDAWYNAFLEQCRYGRLCLEMYHTFHGHPTMLPGSNAAIPSADDAELRPSLQCRTQGCAEGLVFIPRLGFTKRAWIEAFLSQGHTGRQLNSTECETCACERKRRARVISYEAPPTDELQREPFASAPAIYSYNVPKYFSILLRAREWAKANNQQLSWCTARDVPLLREDRELPEDKLKAKLRGWLERHDQKTAHITSLTPLARGMPVRLTDTVDRELKLYRGRKGFLVNWAPHPEETRELMDDEWVLSRMPKALYVKFPGATFQISDDLEPGVYPLAQPHAHGRG